MSNVLVTASTNFQTKLTITYSNQCFLTLNQASDGFEKGLISPHGFMYSPSFKSVI